MEDFVFDEPVVINLGEAGRVRRVVMASQAADYLLHRWPVKGGQKHRAAREALMDALQGLKQARDVRIAFQAAAQEARILVPPSTAMISARSTAIRSMRFGPYVETLISWIMRALGRRSRSRATTAFRTSASAELR